ncbi:hypothetical protein NPIL_206961 [Nephila pilipes]|uniref:Uncharacterized protein n=1 Tax=Nephila pilipes TaxID=299642 RepID=A0A8X6PY32_NEPPI|nr:hypothetical protein NPIL_206961 [Nephila pilipes]
MQPYNRKPPPPKKFFCDFWMIPCSRCPPEAAKANEDSFLAVDVLCFSSLKPYSESLLPLNTLADLSQLSLTYEMSL